MHGRSAWHGGSILGSVEYVRSRSEQCQGLRSVGFSPSLNFTGTGAITNLGGGTYRLAMASIPAHLILSLTLSNITDAAGNALSAGTITINDNDTDGMADDWEAANGVAGPFRRVPRAPSDSWLLCATALRPRGVYSCRSAVMGSSRAARMAG